MLNGTVERGASWVRLSPSVCRLITCCADAPPFTSFVRYSPRSGPSFTALQDDPDYRRAIADADLAIADSGLCGAIWNLIQCEKLTRISGLTLFKALLETPQVRVPQNLFLFCQECSQEFVRLDDVAVCRRFFGASAIPALTIAADSAAIDPRTVCFRQWPGKGDRCGRQGGFSYCPN